MGNGRGGNQRVVSASGDVFGECGQHARVGAPHRQGAIENGDEGEKVLNKGATLRPARRRACCTLSNMD